MTVSVFTANGLHQHTDQWLTQTVHRLKGRVIVLLIAQPGIEAVWAGSSVQTLDGELNAMWVIEGEENDFE
jgi:hypothetical protein